MDRPEPSTEAAVRRVRGLFRESIEVKQRVAEGHAGTIVAIAGAVAACLRQGGVVLLCGNGGSAADAQHLATELTIRLRPDPPRSGFPALALATDTSSLTACGNDLSFEEYFERQTRTFGRPGDVLIGISTSGRSPNVVRALRAARELGLVTIGFLGGSGEPARDACDHAIVVPSSSTSRIQEAHITIGHTILELVEDELVERGAGA